MSINKGKIKPWIWFAILVAVAIAAGWYFTHHNNVPIQ